MCGRRTRQIGSRNPGIYERQFVPLCRVSEHRRRDRPGARQNGSGMMRPFRYQRARDAADAVGSAASLTRADMAAVEAPTQFLAGGTTLIDLMKLDVMRPGKVIDIKPIARRHS